MEEEMNSEEELRNFKLVIEKIIQRLVHQVLL